jgi:hypothetical protein
MFGKCLFACEAQNLAIDNIASLLVNLRSDHTIAICGRRSIDIYSSKGSAFMFGLLRRLSMISLPITDPSLFGVQMTLSFASPEITHDAT